MSVVLCFHVNAMASVDVAFFLTLHVVVDVPGSTHHAGDAPTLGLAT